MMTFWSSDDGTGSRIVENKLTTIDLSTLGLIRRELQQTY
jgi:hypothetical protein